MKHWPLPESNCCPAGQATQVPSGFLTWVLVEYGPVCTAAGATFALASSTQIRPSWCRPTPQASVMTGAFGSRGTAQTPAALRTALAGQALGPETQMPLALRIRPASQADGVIFTRATRRRADHRRGVSSGRRRCSDFRRRDERNFRSRFWGRFSCRGALAAGVFDLSGGHACAYAASIDSGPTRSAPSTSARPRRANQLARRFSRATATKLCITRRPRNSVDASHGDREEVSDVRCLRPPPAPTSLVFVQIQVKARGRQAGTHIAGCFDLHDRVARLGATAGSLSVNPDIQAECNGACFRGLGAVL